MSRTVSRDPPRVFLRLRSQAEAVEVTLSAGDVIGWELCDRNDSVWFHTCFYTQGGTLHTIFVQYKSTGCFRCGKVPESVMGVGPRPGGDTTLFLTCGDAVCGRDINRFCLTLVQSESMCLRRECRRKADSLRCSRCREASYCSVECQRIDWPQHRNYCRDIKPPESPQLSSTPHSLLELGEIQQRLI
jgi:hypothetical protein